MRIIDHVIVGHTGSSAGGAGAREGEVFNPNTGQVVTAVDTNLGNAAIGALEYDSA
ncbi:MAG: hypothetical protein IH998_16775, partial [Proteobacteria bacterium]|nr:hypothetical protein [Pseudomonadota bacterium]